MKYAIGASAAAAILTLLTVSGQVFAQSHIDIKFSHVVAPDTPKGKAAVKFKELAEQYTGGKVTIDVYPNSQLYKDKEELEALQLGVVFDAFAEGLQPERLAELNECVNECRRGLW